MKKIVFIVILTIGMMSGVENGFSAILQNPMTQDLKGGFIIDFGENLRCEDSLAKV